MDIVKLPRKLQDFRSLVRKALNLNQEQNDLLFSIPEYKWKEILEVNFKGNLEYARRVILEKEEMIKKTDEVLLDKEKNKIDNLQFATNKFIHFLNNELPILFITDYDNDGSLSQSVINQYKTLESKVFKDTSKLYVEYAREVEGNKSRGLTLELIQDLVKEKNINTDKPFLIVTADNGINSLIEQKRIQQNYPNVELIITDHHEPENGMVIEENEKTIIVNPKYDAKKYQSEQMQKQRGNFNKEKTDFFEKYNISGATTIAVLLKNVLETEYENDVFVRSEDYKNGIDLLSLISRVSNVLDYVNSSPEDKLYALDEIYRYSNIQSLLNVNNSMMPFIKNNDKKEELINFLEKNISNFEKKSFEEALQNIFVLNKYAQVILTLIKDFEKLKEDSFTNLKLKELIEIKNKQGFNSDYLSYIYLLKAHEENDFEKINKYFIENGVKFNLFKSNNENYIEQLRPFIFTYMADKNKNNYEVQILNQAIELYEELRKQEKVIMKELRKGMVVKNYQSDNVSISIVNDDIKDLINRKLITKTYNRANNGFNLILDNISEDKISGSFRSIFDIDEIINNKEFNALLNKHNIHIETPGHKKAAGFIITSRVGEKLKTEKILEELKDVIDKQISLLKEKEIEEKLIETDVFNIDFINNFNEVIRGNIPFYKGINPIVKLHKDFVYVNQKTNEQLTLQEYVEQHKYGYIQLLLELPKNGEKEKNLIIPVEMLRKIISDSELDENGYYKDYLQLNYLNDGLFMVNNIIPTNKVNINNTISIKTNTHKEKEVEEAFKDKKLDKVVSISREELRENAFFKYSEHGDDDFNVFENMIIGILDNTGKDYYATFDVEATGFSNAKLLNLGAINYFIDPNSGEKINKKDFENQSYFSIKNNRYLLTEGDENNIKKLTQEEYISLLRKNETKNIFFKMNKKREKTPYLYEGKKIKIFNFKEEDGKIIFNRQIKAESLSRLVKEKDFKMPIYMTYLTGVTNQHLAKYGKPIEEVDNFFFDYYKNKKIVIGAHNTNYDLRIVRANMKKFYDVLINKKNLLFDTAMFSKNEMLAYDEVNGLKIKGVPEIPENVIFYNNINSKVNYASFLKNKEGEYPDRTGKYRLVFNNNELYIHEYKNNSIEKLKINEKIDELLIGFKEQENIKPKKSSTLIKNDKKEIYSTLSSFDEYSENGKVEFKKNLPINTIKYSAQALANQKIIRNLLLDGKDFKVNIIIDFNKYPSLKKHEVELLEFMISYRFDKSFYDNLTDQNLNHLLFLDEFMSLNKDMVNFEKDFLNKNKDLVNCFNDSWYYKEILTRKEPSIKQENRDLNQETYEILANQTGFPIKIIEEVLTNALAFKKKYGIEQLIQHELHVNGPTNGDVNFETPLTLSLLATKTMSNSINVKSDNAQGNLTIPINLFLDNAEKYTLNTYLALKEKVITEDSMGYTQLVNYDRKHKSDLAKEKQYDLFELENNQENVVRFKLGSGVLQTDTHIVGITKQQMGLEEIRKCVNKIAFIMKVNQSFSENEMINEMLEANNYKKERYIKELSKYFRYLELSGEVKQLSDINDFIYKKEWGVKTPAQFVKKVKSSEDISLYALKNLLETVEKLQKNNTDIKYIEIVSTLSDFIKEVERSKTEENENKNKQDPLGIAFENGEDYLSNGQSLQKNVKRMNPVQYMLNNFSLLELTGQYVSSIYDESLKRTVDKIEEEKMENKLKEKEVKKRRKNNI